MRGEIFESADAIIESYRSNGDSGNERFDRVEYESSVEAIEPTAEEAELAVAAARAVGLRFCGVDLLRSAHGPTVVEVNGSPGLEGIERATGGDFATAALRSLGDAIAATGGTR